MGIESQTIVETAAKRVRKARRIVIKVGTSVVVGDDGLPRKKLIESIVRSISSLKSDGRQIVLVSSGAVGIGRAKLQLNQMRLSDLVLRQACAAVGQSGLMNLYETAFGSHGVNVGQVLLTEDDFTHRKRYSNLRHAMERLLKLRVVPIVNENDSTSTAEIELRESFGGRVFSDNDRLAALIMSKLEAELLILLTNVDGVLGKNSRVIQLVSEMSTDVKSLASGPSAAGRGGMITKLEAAEIAMRAGGIAVIANGSHDGILEQIIAGEGVGTTFVSDTRLGGKRRWIKYAAGVRGRLTINPGARKAILERKASLLSSGVISVERKFKAMEVVSIIDHEGREFARGIVNYPSHETEMMIATSPSSNGRKKARVLVTRDNIVLME